MEFKVSVEEFKMTDGAVQIMTETATVISPDGREYTAGGATITPNMAVAYLAKREGKWVVTTFSGDILGPARITSSWRTPRSYVSDKMYQVEATINGRTYTGRSAGEGMLWRGKAIRQ